MTPAPELVLHVLPPSHPSRTAEAALRFKGLGTPGFYVPWMRPAMFVGGLATNLDDRASRRVVYNSGAQLDFSISALSVLDLMLSVGGAVALEDRHAPRYEAMISLKVLR